MILRYTVVETDGRTTTSTITDLDGHTAWAVARLLDKWESVTTTHRLDGSVWTWTKEDA